MKSRILLSAIIISFIVFACTVGIMFYAKYLRSEYQHGEWRTMHSLEKPHVKLTVSYSYGIILSFIYFLAINIFCLLKIRKILNKLLSAFALLLVLGMCVVDIIMMIDAKHTSIDEIGFIFAIWAYVQMILLMPICIDVYLEEGQP